MAENFMTPYIGQTELGLNINDIITPDENVMSECVGGGGTPSEANCSGVTSLLSQNDPDIEQKKKAYVEILEQPQPKALRFRYSCEGRSAGSIPGVRSTAENKTFPTIKIVNYKGPAVVVVSCVTIDYPHRPHPHNLVGKEGCSKGVCTVTIDNDSMECMFSNLGIQCVKKKNVDEALRLRKEIRVDPFNTGFQHRNQPQTIDMNAVRLCFQVFLNSGKNGNFNFPLPAVVSDPIYDKKAISDLTICKLSDCTSCVTGGKEIILLCDKVTKEDIQVRFFQLKNGEQEWEAFGEFQASDVHKQVAISFKTPKYKDLQVENIVQVFIELRRPSDDSSSEPRPFQYLPMDAEWVYGLDNKRKRMDDNKSPNLQPSTSNEYLNYILRNKVYSGARHIVDQGAASLNPTNVSPRGARDSVKVEPPDPFCLAHSPEPRGVRVKPSIPTHHNGGGIMYLNTSVPSPQPGTTIPPHLSPNPFFVPHSTSNPFYQDNPSSIESSHTAYSPENPPGTSPYLMGMLPTIPTYPNFSNNNSKPPLENMVTLPDLGVINSSELNIDSVNNLSANLTSSLSLMDAPLNPLDKGKSEEYKRSLHTPNCDTFVANIPTNVSETMKSEDGIPTTSTSDSVKLLRRQLESLNKMSALS